MGAAAQDHINSYSAQAVQGMLTLPLSHTQRLLPSWAVLSFYYPVFCLTDGVVAHRNGHS